MPFPKDSSQNSMSDQEEEEEDQEQTPTIPLQHQRVPSSVPKWKRISFVPAAAAATAATNIPFDSATSADSTSRKGKTAAERYLEIISSTISRAPPKDKESVGPEAEENGTTTQSRQLQLPIPKPRATRCTVCNLPLTITTSHNHNHESLLAHQVSLPHVYPPSHLDRKRIGLRFLEAQGWDPDSRLGLGKVGFEGRREPIKVIEKRDRLALGVVVPPTVLDKAGKVKKLGAKEARRLAVRERKERLVLGEKVFGNGDEVERLLYGKG